MRWLVCCLGLLLALGHANAGSLEARLIRASKDAKEVDPTIKAILPKLQKIFGYEHYHQIGMDTQAFRGQQALRLDIGEKFTVVCHPNYVEEKVHNMDIEIYAGPTLLLRVPSLKIKEKHFVFIKGPEVGYDWIIIALRVVE